MIPRPVIRSESAMIRRSIIDPRRRDRWDGATPPAKLDFHAANAITRSSAHRVFRCERVGAPRITRRVTIITRPQFIIQTLCTGSRVDANTRSRATDRSVARQRQPNLAFDRLCQRPLTSRFHSFFSFLFFESSRRIKRRARGGERGCIVFHGVKCICTCDFIQV